MSDNNPGFRKGHKKMGGRKAGTPNKVTKEQQERIRTFFERHWDEFENEIWPQLTAKDKKDTFVSLLNYQYPKLTSVDLSGQVKTDDAALGMLREAVGDSEIV